MKKQGKKVRFTTRTVTCRLETLPICREFGNRVALNYLRSGAPFVTYGAMIIKLLIFNVFNCSIEITLNVIGLFAKRSDEITFQTRPCGVPTYMQGRLDNPHSTCGR